MFKTILKSFRRYRLPSFPGNPNLRRDLGLEKADHRDVFLARINSNLGGWV